MNEAESDTDTDNKERVAPILIDLGKHKSKKIKRLLKGKRGRLLDEVKRCYEELEVNDVVAEGVQPVVIIVREKKKKRKRGGLRLGF